MADPAPSFSELVDLAKAEALDVNTKLTFNNGDVSEAILHAGAAMFDWLVGWFSGEVRRLFFGGAKGDDLDEIITDRLKTSRNPAAAAYGNVVFRRTGAGSAGVIPQGTQVATPIDSTGKRNVYALGQDLAYTPDAFTVSGRATCVTTGRDTTAMEGYLNLTILSDLGDSTITAYSAGFAGGADKETDEDYLSRAVGLWTTQRRATLESLEIGAQQVPGIATAKAVEDPDTGFVTVYVADQSGESSSEMEYEATKELEVWRAAGCALTVRGRGAAVLVLTVSIDKYAAGFDVAAAASLIADSITNRVNSLKPGQDLTLDMLRTAACAPFAGEIFKVSFPNMVFDGRVHSDSADLVADGKLIRLDGTPTIIDGAA